MSFSYVVTSQKSTAVHSSCVCSFTSPTDRNLVIAKGNHLEIYTLREDTITFENDLPLYGKITALDFYRNKDTFQDELFVLTEKKHFCILYCDAMRKVVTRTTGNLKDRVGRDTEYGQRGFVDPDRRMIATLLYEGLMKVIPIEGTGLKDSFNLRLEMLRFLDIKFLHGCSRPTLCMLYEDNRGARHIKTYKVDLRDKEISVGEWSQTNVENGARFLIPVPSPSNGVIVVGETTVTYLSPTGVVQAVAIQQTQFVAHGMIGMDGSRFLLGDNVGSLYVLILTKDNDKVVNIVMDYVGVTSIAETLTYLDNGMVFVGSTFGDSQLIKLKDIPDDHGNCVEILEHYTNIGPVLDMCVVASERQGILSSLTTHSLIRHIQPNPAEYLPTLPSHVSFQAFSLLRPFWRTHSHYPLSTSLTHCIPLPSSLHPFHPLSSPLTLSHPLSPSLTLSRLPYRPMPGCDLFRCLQRWFLACHSQRYRNQGTSCDGSTWNQR